MNEKEIKEEAKKIIDKFMSSLKNIEINDVKFEEGELRKEKDGECKNFDFRKIMFKNAPEKNEDCIIAEKGEWVE